MMRETKDDDQAKIYMCQGPPGTGNFNLLEKNIIRSSFFFKGKSQTITGIVRALLQVGISSLKHVKIRWVVLVISIECHRYCINICHNKETN